FLCFYCFYLFFFTDPATTEFSTLSLHDALPISGRICGVSFIELYSSCADDDSSSITIPTGIFVSACNVTNCTMTNHVTTRGKHRSEERRVGKEGRSKRQTYQDRVTKKQIEIEVL